MGAGALISYSNSHTNVLSFVDKTVYKKNERLPDLMLTECTLTAD